ncbi:hypothetical protein BLAT2472_10297 [Burkholderia latens]
MCMLQICYSKGPKPCWISLALVIPSPELRGESSAARVRVSLSAKRATEWLRASSVPAGDRAKDGQAVLAPR